MGERRPSVRDPGGLLDGERKLVTVLFADIVKSSILISGKDPEDANQILLSVLEIMIESVHRFNGTVNQILGDGIMAIFGAPVAQEDHAVRACFAADAMQANVQQIFRAKPRRRGSTVAIRIGLNSGEVMAHTVENDLYAEYRVVGEAVHLAALMESIAKPSSTALTTATLKLVSDHAETTPLAPASLTSGPNKIGAFELVRVTRDHGVIERLSRRSSGLFVGRERDIQVMHNALRNVEDGIGKFLVVTGEAGVGKSRLVFEFLESIRMDEHQLVECDMLPAGFAKSLAPLARIICSLATVEQSHPSEQIRETVSALLKSPVDDELLGRLEGEFQRHWAPRRDVTPRQSRKRVWGRI